MLHDILKFFFELDDFMLEEIRFVWKDEKV